MRACVCHANHTCTLLRPWLDRRLCVHSRALLGRVTPRARVRAQAVTFLVIHQKAKKSLNEIMGDLCPMLSVQQLYRISTMYWDDRYGTETVAPEVLARMKQHMVDNNTSASHSFLLDDDSSIPFSLDDISNLMEDKVSVQQKSASFVCL